MAGCIVGAAVYHSIYMNNFDVVTRLNNELQEQLEQNAKDIDLLNKYKNQHTVIKSIVPYIEHGEKPLNSLVEAELKKRLKEDLSAFIGQSVYSIDDNAELARKLLKDKLYPAVRGSDYQISIKTILVADNVLQIWAYARVYERPPA